MSNLKFDKDVGYNNFNNIEDKTDKSIDDIFVYFDFSICRDGYMREVHTDMNNRIFSFMLYLSEVDGEGGTLDLYSMQDGTGPKVLSEENGKQKIEFNRDNSNISLEKSIQPKENLGIWKLDCENSWHAVPEMKNNKDWRKFVYVAVTSKKQKVWKNKDIGMFGLSPNSEQLKIKKSLKF